MLLPTCWSMVCCVNKGMIILPGHPRAPLGPRPVRGPCDTTLQSSLRRLDSSPFAVRVRRDWQKRAGRFSPDETVLCSGAPRELLSASVSAWLRAHHGRLTTYHLKGPVNDVVGDAVTDELNVAMLCKLLQQSPGKLQLLAFRALDEQGEI